MDCAHDREPSSCPHCTSGNCTCTTCVVTAQKAEKMRLFQEWSWTQPCSLPDIGVVPYGTHRKTPCPCGAVQPELLDGVGDT